MNHIMRFRLGCFVKQCRNNLLLFLGVENRDIRNELSWEFNVGIITPWELVNQMVFCIKFRFVSFLLNFSHVGTDLWLPEYYQYFFRSKFVLLKDTTWCPK